MLNISTLPKYKSIVIIGKGPSLDNYFRLIRPNDTVISVNECTPLIKTKNLHFHFQFDDIKMDIADAIPIVPAHIQNLYNDGYFFTKKEFHLAYRNSGVVAIAVAKYLGVEDLLLVGLEGITGGTREYGKILPEKSRMPDPNPAYDLYPDYVKILLKDVNWSKAW